MRGEKYFIGVAGIGVWITEDPPGVDLFYESNKQHHYIDGDICQKIADLCNRDKYRAGDSDANIAIQQAGVADLPAIVRRFGAVAYIFPGGKIR